MAGKDALKFRQQPIAQTRAGQGAISKPFDNHFDGARQASDRIAVARVVNQRAMQQPLQRHLRSAAGRDVAPVFAGGSNIGISAASEKQESALELMKIIFSDEYQTLLAENGLGPANTDFGFRVTLDTPFPRGLPLSLSV